MNTTQRKTTPPTSLQDIFDRAWDRLITHHELGRCMLPSGRSCSYKQGDNCCVIGWMLPDNILEELTELESNHAAFDTGITSLLREDDDAYTQSVRTFFQFDYYSRGGLLLRQLQTVHDREATLADTRTRLQIIAMEFNLVVPTT